MTTQRDFVLEALPVGKIKTQMELLAEIGDVVPKDSLSSLLKRMVDKGELFRVRGIGPRGGFGYWAAVGNR